MELKPERAGRRCQSVIMQVAVCLAEVDRRVRAEEGTRIHTLSSPPSRLSNEMEGMMSVHSIPQASGM